MSRPPATRARTSSSRVDNGGPTGATYPFDPATTAKRSSSSSLAVSITTRVVGLASRMAPAVAMPDGPGIRTSRRTTSGARIGHGRLGPVTVVDLAHDDDPGVVGQDLTEGGTKDRVVVDYENPDGLVVASRTGQAVIWTGTPRGSILARRVTPALLMRMHPALTFRPSEEGSLVPWIPTVPGPPPKLNRTLENADSP